MAARTSGLQGAADLVELQKKPLSLLDLPNEILHLIATFLDQEYQALFSLSCARLRVLLSSNFDLSMFNKDSRLRFSRYLEIDFPEWIPCRKCGFMCNWQKKQQSWIWNKYVCACKTFFWSSYFITYLEVRQTYGLTLETVDLMLRANERGLKYGLPLSLLSDTRKTTGYLNYFNSIETTEARIIAGQFILAFRWDAEFTVENAQPAAIIIDLDLCPHCVYFDTRDCLCDGKFGRGESAARPFLPCLVANMESWKAPYLFKCPTCAADYWIDFRVNGDQAQLKTDARFNYGQRYDNTTAIENVYRCNNFLMHGPRINRDELAKRDLHALFESAAPETQDTRGFNWSGQFSSF